MKELILATSNRGKIREFNRLLAPIHCTPQGELGIVDAEESGLSFVENALLKARHACYHAKKPALADDSGLVVPTLNGEPGIYSARYAERKVSDLSNIDLLLESMACLKDQERSGYFYCAIALVNSPQDPTPIIATGICHGVIAQQASGNNGFGYDPIFYLPEYQCTMAQLDDRIKNMLSHRAHALQELKRLLSQQDQF